MSSAAPTPDVYVSQITDEDRRALVSRLRDLINANIPDGFVEDMAYGMIGWTVPMEVSGPTYNGKPLNIVALGNQKNYVSIYLMGLYASQHTATAEFESAWKATGRKLDMGKSCVRVKRWDDVAEDVLAGAVAAMSVEECLGAADAR